MESTGFYIGPGKSRWRWQRNKSLGFTDGYSPTNGWHHHDSAHLCASATKPTILKSSCCVAGCDWLHAFRTTTCCEILQTKSRPAPSGHLSSVQSWSHCDDVQTRSGGSWLVCVCESLIRYSGCIKSSSVAAVSGPLLVRGSEACQLVNTHNCGLILPPAAANIWWTANEARPAHQGPP